MPRAVTVIGAPMDLGADRRGVDMGPSSIRYAGLAAELESIGRTCTDDGDIEVPKPERADPYEVSAASGEAKYVDAVETVCRRLEQRVADARRNGTVPLVLGGDHSIAIGTVNGVAADDVPGVLWFDAHADFNTPATSPSGNVHGMPVAAMLGRGEFGQTDWAPPEELREDNVAMVGLRSIDGTEAEALRESDVHTYTMSDVDRRGLRAVTADAIGAVTEDTDAVHVSFDLDFMNPTEAPGVGTPVSGGVTYREAHTAMELVWEQVGDSLASLELVEANPILDEHNVTSELAVELAASALGKQIL